MLGVLTEQLQLKHVLKIGPISSRLVHLLPIIPSSVLFIGYIIKYGPDPPLFATYSHVAFSYNSVSHHSHFTLL